MSRTFLKMNGLGNDFVVIETLTQPFEPSAEEIRQIAKRGQGGIGCDQVVAIDPPKAEGASAYVRFWNADGEVAGTFGRNGRNAGQFHWVHNIAIDSAGNVFTSEVDNAKRVQKFRPLDGPPQR